MVASARSLLTHRLGVRGCVLSATTKQRAGGLQLGRPLKNTRYLEPLAFLNIQLGFVLDNRANVGFKFVH